MSQTLIGVLRVGEANVSAATIRARAGGPGWTHQFALIVAVAVCAIAGWEIGAALGEWRVVGAVVGTASADFLYNFVARRVLLVGYKRRFATAGLPLDLPMRLTIEPDALVSEVGGVKQIISWPCVTDLFHNRGYWIILAQGDAIFAPERLFASPNDQRAFVAAVLSHMSEGARARSLQAVVFAADAS